MQSGPLNKQISEIMRVGKLSDIPNGWQETTLDDVCQVIRGVTFPTNEKRYQPGSGLIACLRTANVQAIVEWDNLWFIPKDYVKNENQFVAIDDVLISNANSLELVGKVSRVTHLRYPSTLGAFISLLRAEKGLNAAFLYYQMSTEEVQRSIRNMSSTTTNISNVSSSKLKTLPIKIAPILEQDRIVQKLEELLSDLDAGVAELNVAKKKLASYRQALLKNAMEGALTADWRIKNTPDETASALLERILIERRVWWEAKQLAKFKEQGRKPTKDWQSKYPKPISPALEGLPELPKEWVWVTLDMLGEIASGVAKGTKVNADVPLHEVPYLRVANVQRGFLDLSEVKTIFATDRQISELTLQVGDVLFNEGGDRDKLGRGWVWNDEVPSCIHQNHVFRLRPYLAEILPELVSHHGNTFGKAWFQRAGKQTTNLASINMTMLRHFPVPLSSAAEQKELLAQLQYHLDALDRQEKAVVQGLKQAAVQRKNILKNAFSGCLVIQDPMDEPATFVLERIRKARIEREKQPKPRKAREKKENSTMASQLIDVLAKADDWMQAQDVFELCGVSEGTLPDRIEELYAELRSLDKANRLESKRYGDYDLIRLRGE